MATGVTRSGKAGKGSTRWDFGLNTSKDTSKASDKDTSSRAKSPVVKDQSRVPAYRKGGLVKKRGKKC
jgi:hypothetical protein